MGICKKLRLCFRCLGEGHLGQYCTRTRVCGLNGCKELHHRLLHTDLHHGGDRTIPSQCPGTKSELEQSAALRKKSENDKKTVKTGSSREGDQMTCENKFTLSTEAMLVMGFTGSIALRTIPVCLQNGNKRLRVNALLDDASTKTYINADVAAEIDLQGELKVNVNVLNGQLKSFETTPVECMIESLDGKTSL